MDYLDFFVVRHLFLSVRFTVDHNYDLNKKVYYGQEIVSELKVFGCLNAIIQNINRHS